MSDVTTVNCPTCGKTVVWGEVSPFRPFCCKRCQLIDRANGRRKRNAFRAKAISDSDDWSSNQSLLALRLAGLRLCNQPEYHRLIGGREFFRIAGLKLNPVTRLPLFTPRFTFPAFHQPEPQRDVTIRKLVLQLIEQRCAKRVIPTSS